MVSAVTFREPALLVEAVTTRDVLSGGRAWLGIGAGYQLQEAAARGLFMPPVPERFERLDEALRIALAMWDGDQRPIQGTHYQLAHPTCYPPPATRPHPPIIIGGTGEKHTLRLVAQYADACNLFDIPDGGRTVRHKRRVMSAIMTHRWTTITGSCRTRRGSSTTRTVGSADSPPASPPTPPGGRAP